MEGHEEIVAVAATGQGLEIVGRQAQTLEHFLKLAFRVRRGQHYQIGPFQVRARPSAGSGCRSGAWGTAGFRAYPRPGA